MASYCVYTIPIAGNVSIDKPLAFQIDDIDIEFFMHSGILSHLVIKCPIPSSPTTEERIGDNLITNEPRAREIEEIVLHIGNGFSLFSYSCVEFLFEKRRVQWIINDKPSSIKVDINGGPTAATSAKHLTTPLFIRSVLVGCIEKNHDPALTFFSRGSTDANSHRFIEAYYNLFFFLEFLYGNGKSGKNATLDEFMKSNELTTSIKNTLEKPEINELLSRSFVEKLRASNTRKILEILILARGSLHHPNKNRTDNWNPEKQRHFGDEAIFLQFVCLEIAFHRYFAVGFTQKIDHAYKKVERCMRRDSSIRIFTTSL